MTSLPSFVDLMASLGLEQKEHPTSKPSSLLYSAPPTLSMTRSHSAPSRHPTIQKQRYSPYFSAAAPKRRGSLSSATLGPEQTLRRHDRCQSVGVGKQNSVYQATNFIDSTSDAGANAPISTYVRRKRSGSGCFLMSSIPLSNGNGNAPNVQLPCIPVLPTLLPSRSYAKDPVVSRTDNTSNFDARYFSQPSSQGLSSHRSHQRKGVPVSIPTWIVQPQNMTEFGHCRTTL